MTEAKSKVLCSLALVAIVLFALALVGNVHFGYAQTGTNINTEKPPTWTAQTVDPKAAEGSIMAFDNHNLLHVAYTNYQGGDPRKPEYAMYATLNGSSWNIENTNVPGVVADFKLDANGNPIFLVELYSLPTQSTAYGSAEGLGIVTKTGANWTTQMLDSQGLAGSLALDSNGSPHVAYIKNGNPPSLNYAVWTGNKWNIQSVDSNVSDTWDSNVILRLGSNGAAHIMYENYPDIEYATLNQQGWRIQTLLQNAQLNDMVLDSSGSVDFLYDNNLTASSNNSLIYSRWNGQSLTNLTVASNVPVPNIQFSAPAIGAGYASLMLDSNNYPNIDYYNGGGGNNVGASLFYSRWTGETWETQTVDSEFATSSGPIVLDSYGNPHICYSGLQDTVYYFAAYLMYATAIEPALNITPSATPSPSPTIPEFPSWLVLPLLIIFVSIAGVYLGRKLKTH